MTRPKFHGPQVEKTCCSAYELLAQPATRTMRTHWSLTQIEKHYQ